MSMKGKETMSKQNEKKVVGKLGSSYGIRGWLKV
ncbi:ribosome maturation factor RimM, partial [Vibrio cholerae]